MRLRCKRWSYALNGRKIVVECAYSLFGWCQERLIVNGQELARSGGRWRLKVELEACLTDEQLPTRLQAVLSPGFLTVHCLLWVHGAPIPSRRRAERFPINLPKGRWPEIVPDSALIASPPNSVSS